MNNDGYRRLLEVNPQAARLPWTEDNILFLINYAYTVGKQDGISEVLKVMKNGEQEIHKQ